ncbi:RNA-directed DNA polymerase, eukaryota [Tanacetum coccineum]|uniref:RNA-directed DNA polymerase, eukaryota n=1 Tax=Tanacetum coccineum TaxID=301880 RepID=A0ABQ5FBW6_9ASTR
MRDFMYIKVGNGETTKFWDDIWIGSKPLKLLFPRIYALDNIKDASICMKLNEPSLDNNFRRSIRGGIEQSQFKKLTDLLIPIVLNPCPDRWFWSLEGSGEFSVASIRRFIDDQRLLTVDSKTLWIKSVPIKVNILAWKIKLEALPTRFNISRRGIEIDSILCPICDRGVESTRHIFFSCCLVRQIARKICSWWDIEYSDVNSFTEWINWMASLRLQSKVKMMIQGVFFVVWWLVWSYRNKLLFEEKKPSKAIIFDDVVSISFYWEQVTYYSCDNVCKSKKAANINDVVFSTEGVNGTANLVLFEMDVKSLLDGASAYQLLATQERDLASVIDDNGTPSEDMHKDIMMGALDDLAFVIDDNGTPSNTPVDMHKDIVMASGSNRDAEDALCKLLQTGTVTKYESKFEILISRVTGKSESLLKTFYISGLKSALQCALLRSNPKTLDEAFTLAHATKAHFMDLQLWEFLRSNPSNLGEAFFKARFIEAHFEDEWSTIAIAKTNDLNKWVHVQDLELETKVLVDGKQDDAKVVVVAGHQNSDEPNILKVHKEKKDEDCYSKKIIGSWNQEFSRQYLEGKVVLKE